jgi:hypothetical protein
MNSISKIENRREAIAKEMLSIRSMKRGSISEQYLNVRRKGHSQPVKRGPYYVLSRNENGRTVSRRLTTDAERQRTQEDIERHKQFVALCREFVELSERLGELESEAASPESKKKRRRSPSNRTRR